MNLFHYSIAFQISLFERSINSLLFLFILFRELFVSFGGLLMCLKGDVATFQKFTLDSLLYLLIRKVH